MRVAIRVDRKFDALAVVLEQVLPDGGVQQIQTVRNFPRSDLLCRRKALVCAQLQAGFYQTELHVPEED